jgi:Fe(II)/alpha-ketoglutarate-dependent arginine beta-hydroxylase
MLALFLEAGLGERITRYEVGDVESIAVQSLVNRLAGEIADDLTEDDLRRFALLSHELPAGLRAALVDFRLGAPGAPEGGFVITGVPFDNADLQPTPHNATDSARGLEIRRSNAMLLLLASVLGDPFSLAGVHDGRLINDIFPVKGDEETQLASSSSGELVWHNEDAYSDHRADWLLLMCLRNPEPRVPTTFARLADALPDLADDVVEALYRNHYLMRPDSSHGPETGESTPRVIAVLEGRRDAPFVRIDPAFMSAVRPEAEQALAAAITAVGRRLQDVALAPGDVLVIDNYRAVHGRRPFIPRYDGTDRWLRIVNVTSNLRRFTGPRQGRHNRALFGGDGQFGGRYS